MWSSFKQSMVSFACWRKAIDSCAEEKSSVWAVKCWLSTLAHCWQHTHTQLHALMRLTHTTKVGCQLISKLIAAANSRQTHSTQLAQTINCTWANFFEQKSLTLLLLLLFERLEKHIIRVEARKREKKWWKQDENSLFVGGRKKVSLEWKYVN